MENEKKLRKIRIVAAAAAVFLVLLICSLALNLIKLAASASREDALTKELARLTDQEKRNADEIAFRSTDEYVEQVAREYLDMKYKNEKAFKGD